MLGIAVGLASLIVGIGCSNGNTDNYWNQKLGYWRNDGIRMAVSSNQNGVLRGVFLADGIREIVCENGEPLHYAVNGRKIMTRSKPLFQFYGLEVPTRTVWVDQDYVSTHPNEKPPEQFATEACHEMAQRIAEQR